MPLNLTLNDAKPIEAEDDPLGRSWVGYHREMVDEDVFEQNRGMWVLGKAAHAERYATFAYAGTVVAVAEIREIETLPWPRPDTRRPKQALRGRVLAKGEAAYDQWIGRSVPVHRNPVGYLGTPPSAT